MESAAGGPSSAGVGARREHGLFHQGDRFEGVVDPGGAMQVLADADDDGGARIESHARTLRIVTVSNTTVLPIEAGTST